MKKIKPILILMLCLAVNLATAQKTEKKYVPQDLMPTKKRTGWVVTKGTAAFGKEIYFNFNHTAQHATGGFGGFKIENNNLILKDLNGKSIDSQKKLTYKIKSLTKTKLVLTDDKGKDIELTIKGK